MGPVMGWPRTTTQEQKDWSRPSNGFLDTSSLLLRTHLWWRQCSEEMKPEVLCVPAGQGGSREGAPWPFEAFPRQAASHSEASIGVRQHTGQQQWQPLGWTVGFFIWVLPEPRPGFPGGSVVKNLPANAGDVGDMDSIPGSGLSTGGGNGNPLQYACLGNPMDRGPDGVQSMGPQRVGHYLLTKQQQSQDGQQGFQMRKWTLSHNLTVHLDQSGNYVFPCPHAVWLFPRVPRAYFSQ